MVPTDRQGIKLLGTPLGHPDHVARHLQSVVQEHRVLLERIPRVDRTGEFARAHDEGIWQCACDILQIEAAQTGLGLRSAERVTNDARHPVVAESLVRELEGRLWPTLANPILANPFSSWCCRKLVAGCWWLVVGGW